MGNFNRQYRLSAGRAGKTGFEIGDGDTPLHIAFSAERADTEAQNTAKVSIWNLSPSNVSKLEREDCVVTLKAGYGSKMSIVFSGVVTFCRTTKDGADRITEVELVDNRIALRDTYVSLNYKGRVSCKQLIQDTMKQMGVAVVYAYNLKFATLKKGYSYVGPAKNVLSKACRASGLVWGIHNGVLQIKRPNDTMSRRVYEISAESGMIGVPTRVEISKKDRGYQYGWDVECLMNTALNIDDYVHLSSKEATGYFRIYSLSFDGDNYEGNWSCVARLLEVK